MKKDKEIILGAIAGDIIGSSFEGHFNIPSDFNLFNEKSKYTDDTVLTIAILETILDGFSKPPEEYLKNYALKYPFSGFGPGFISWVRQPLGVKSNSYGNGAAMRVSAIEALAKNEDELNNWIYQVTTPSHSHPEAIKGASAIAMSIFMAKKGNSKSEISKYITSTFDYNLDIDFELIKKNKKFDVICQTTVPQAISCFLNTGDYESCIRLAVSLGGDTDTLACMSGGIAAACYKSIPSFIKEKTIQRIPEEFLSLILKIG
jgi:ADP-ribosylglycohydrolase